jgi:hypothetical protein
LDNEVSNNGCGSFLDLALTGCCGLGTMSALRNMM